MVKTKNKTKDYIECQGKNHKGKSRLIAPQNFYKSISPMFPLGKIPICKKCLAEMIDYDDINSVYTVLQSIDLPFFKNRWDETCKNNPSNVFGNYLRLANSGINEFGGARWKDSVFGNESEDILDDNTKTPTKRNKISIEELEVLKEKFGDGYPDKEYILFEKKYQDLRPSFQLTTTMHEECLREYCIDKVKEGLAKAKGEFKEAKEWASMAKEQANSGKLNPSQMSKADLSGGLDTFSQMSKMVEQTDEGEMMRILPIFMEKPKDRVDITLWLYVNYVRDLKGLEECEYKDIWEFYNKRVAEYEKKMTDPNPTKDDEGEENE
jgi:hypothetical protein